MVEFMKWVQSVVLAAILAWLGLQFSPSDDDRNDEHSAVFTVVSAIF